jgi:uncharacterized protein YjbI with pentapeptide repeats
METEQTIKLEQTKKRVEATNTDMSGSKFRDVSLSGAAFSDVNLAGATINDCNVSGWRAQNVNFAGLRISNANLTAASIVESWTDGMTIDGIAVADLMATFRVAHPKTN